MPVNIDQSTKNIVDAINSMANIKKSKTDLEKSLLLDQISRERNLQDKKQELSMQTIEPKDEVYSNIYKQGGPKTENEVKFVKDYLGFDKDAEKNKKANLLAATRLRQEFINRPEVKDYITTATNVKAMDSLLKNAKSGNINNQVALQQAIITMYNKLTDPQSVVRESEYARTPENLPIVNAITGAMNKLQKGGAGLTVKDLEALVQGAKIIMNERGSQYNNTLLGYKELASEQDIDENLITQGKQMFEPYDTGIEEPVNYEVGQEIEGKGIHEGKKYRIVGGDPNDPDVEEITE